MTNLRAIFETAGIHVVPFEDEKGPALAATDPDLSSTASEEITIMNTHSSITKSPSPTTSPTLRAVFTAYEAARAEFFGAIDAADKFDSVLREVEREPILSPKIGNAVVEYRGRDADEAFEPVAKAIKAHAAKMRGLNISIGADIAPVDAWEEQTIAGARAQLAVWQARRDECGYTAAEDRLALAMNGETEALLMRARVQ